MFRCSQLRSVSRALVEHIHKQLLSHLYEVTWDAGHGYDFLLKLLWGGRQRGRGGRGGRGPGARQPVRTVGQPGEGEHRLPVLHAELGGAELCCTDCWASLGGDIAAVAKEAPT